MLISLLTLAAEPAEVISLRSVADTEALRETAEMGADGCLRIQNVTRPTLAFYPLDCPDSHPWVLVCPGGGYGLLAYNKEGTAVAEWLNRQGCSAAVLKYTVTGNRDEALKDALVALQILRERSSSLNASSIGMMGFSAGAHLTARAACSDIPPDFTALIYPAYIGDDQYHADPSLKFSQKIPQSFVVQTQDDAPYVNSSVVWFQQLKKVGIPVELHLYPVGGHGYGLFSSAPGLSEWPLRYAEWLKRFQPQFQK